MRGGTTIEPEAKVIANKEYQTADWRLRPLTRDMLRYAAEDTHYLLYIYDLMRIELFALPMESESSDTPLVEVYKCSRDVCMQLYQKELWTEYSYLHIYGLKLKKNLRFSRLIPSLPFPSLSSAR